MNQVQLVARKRDDKWVGALVIDGEFQEVFIKHNLAEIVDQSMLILLPFVDKNLVTINMIMSQSK